MELTETDLYLLYSPTIASDFQKLLPTIKVQIFSFGPFWFQLSLEFVNMCIFNWIEAMFLLNIYLHAQLSHLNGWYEP